MHPTWRDLVIDRLGSDPNARARFLRRCGPHGVVLALSVGGGAAGERRLPLVCGDGDWDGLGDRLYALVPELEPAELVAVLTALRLAIGDLGDSDRDGAAHEARSLARIVLRRVAQLWENRGTPVLLPELDAWLALSKLLVPREMPPSLAVTWTELLPARPPDPGDAVEVHRLADWLVLCRLLGDFLTGLPEALGFGADQVSLVGRFLDRVAEDPVAAARDPVIRALHAIASVIPEQRGRARLLLRNELRDETLERGGGPAGSGPPELDERPGKFSVERVLADL